MASETLQRAGRRIAVGTSLRLAGRSAGALLTLAVVRLLATRLGPAGFGPVVASLAWLVIFGALGGAGIGRAASREIARTPERARALLSSALLLTLASSLAAACVMAALGWAVYPHSRITAELMTTLAPAVIAGSVLQSTGLVLGALRRNGLRAIGDVLSSALVLAGTVSVLAGRRGIIAWGLTYVAAYGVTAAGSAALAWRIAGKVDGSAVTGEAMARRAMFRLAVPMAATDALNGLYYRVDAVLLSVISGGRAVALYGVAYQLAAFAMTAPQFLSGALLPEFMSRGPDDRRRLVGRCIVIALMAGVLVAVLAVVLAPQAVRVLGGPAFGAAATPFAILGAAIALAFVSGFVADVVVFAGGERSIAGAVGLITLTNVVANAVAIPIAGTDGAAIAMVVSQIVACVAVLRRYRRHVRPLLISPVADA